MALSKKDLKKLLSKGLTTSSCASWSFEMEAAIPFAELDETANGDFGVLVSTFPSERDVILNVHRVSQWLTDNFGDSHPYDAIRDAAFEKEILLGPIIVNRAAVHFVWNIHEGQRVSY